MHGMSAYYAQWGMILAQLFASMVCGGIIGYQRETQESPAGFRTHVLVCVGSTVYMMVSMLVGAETHDTGRIAAQVASGIGFLGAGTIIKQGSLVRGLTTAASLWAVAGIGLAVGFGGAAMAVAVLGTLVVFASLSLLKSIEHRMERPHHCTVQITVVHAREHLEEIHETFTAHSVQLSSMRISDELDGVSEVTLEGRTIDPSVVESMVRELGKNPVIHGVHWECR